MDSLSISDRKKRFQYSRLKKSFPFTAGIDDIIFQHPKRRKKQANALKHWPDILFVFHSYTYRGRAVFNYIYYLLFLSFEGFISCILSCKSLYLLFTAPCLRYSDLTFLSNECKKSSSKAFLSASSSSSQW